ncbi:hypothetical protein K461DRAFT_265422 [Myriangium duriaei CBS 260.36]|uniref:Dihydrolipoamide acetyltransferase component of pyruvate dehydrogenase complex n=1 Tax=Myriangium duriaei CBS 260.36 TaxID=1168546 RepID=A0A9P4J6U9_9PEZI|nr:hypothetical protein K461DRAFT_265422 [Myriangium duriaei CBS 260.36]
MAGVLRYSSRLVQRQTRRGFRTSALYNAAQNFTMPAMSPTMTEGNIAAWRVKEGESFAAGDVLLEIETDKAQMDVEAQEDGILFKITQQDGSKAVKVGSRIAVLAESGDDLSSLEVPAEESSKQSQPATKEKSPQDETEGGIDQSRSSESQAEAPPTSKSGSDSSVSSSSQSKPSTSSGKQHKRQYPLYPSVQFLLKEKGISKEETDKIPATGPNGRLLKGDVLAYMGKIEKDYSANQSKRLEKLGHLDLTNITIVQPKKSEAESPAAKEELPAQPQDTEIAMHISLSAVIATQKRVLDTLGIRLPLSVFIARASELANEALPLSASKSNTDDLFYSVLGLDKVVPRASRGNYFPLVTGLPPSPPAVVASLPKKADVFDELIETKPRSRPVAALPPLVGAEGVAAAMNIFSVVAKPGEERRVEAYLEKMKLVLEAEPGRLVV